MTYFYSGWVRNGNLFRRQEAGPGPCESWLLLQLLLGNVGHYRDGCTGDIVGVSCRARPFTPDLS
jgi:hypothetical protein